MKPLMILAACGMLLLAGCLERDEKIRVARDGSVRIEMTIKGDADEFDKGPATLPTREAGWQVRDERDPDKNNVTRTVRAQYRAGEPLPDSFARPGTEEYEVGLSFPTEVVVERRRDGTYYHFRREYPSRNMGRYTYYQEESKKIFNFEEELQGRSLEDLPHEEQVEALRALQHVEFGKQLEDLRDAVREVRDAWPPDYALRLETALRNHFGRSPIEEVLEILNMPEELRDEAEADRISRDFLRELDEVYARVFDELRAPDAAVDEFFAALDIATSRRVVTENLSDEKWTIELELPGEIIAHNADERTDRNVVRWSFEADAMMNRDHVLMATSRVERDAGRAVEGSQE